MSGNGVAGYLVSLNRTSRNRTTCQVFLLPSPNPILTLRAEVLDITLRMCQSLVLTRAFHKVRFNLSFNQKS
jgi:hypothetical protein